MSEPRSWSPEEIELVRIRRAQKRTWVEIAAELGCARCTVVNYARQNGLWTEPLPSIKTSASAEVQDPNRPPLPPGHLYTWGAITDGTLLEGVTYPL